MKSESIKTAADFGRVQRNYWTWSEYNSDMLKLMFTSTAHADEYSDQVHVALIGDFPDFAQDIHDLHDDIDTKIRRLRSISDRLELFNVSDSIAAVATRSTQVSGDDVFIVHGHDEGAREAVARFIEKAGLKAVILNEQANQGMTIVEKLERHSDVRFAVVLLTPDDVGGKSKDALKPRARQNVVLELGYFIGLLGRKRVCALYRGEVELPSDFDGMVYVKYDDAGGWKQKLAQELLEAEFEVDLSKAFK